MYVCLSVWLCTLYMQVNQPEESVGAQEEVVVSHSVWVLRNKHRPFGRGENTRNAEPSPQPSHFSFSQSLCLNLQLTDSAGLAKLKPQGSPALASLVLGWQEHAAKPGFFMASGDQTQTVCEEST